MSLRSFFVLAFFISGTVCSVVAQGLYQIAPSDDEASSSLPLTYIVAARIGCDSYPMPLQAEVSLLERNEVTPFIGHRN